MVKQCWPVVVVLGVMAAACGGRSLGGNSNQRAPDGALSDAGLPDAAAPADASVCDDAGLVFEMRHVPMDSLTLLEAPAIVEGQQLRLAVGVSFVGCDRFAGVQLDVDPTSRQVRLYAHVWGAVGDPLCADVLWHTEEILVLADLAVGEWRVVGVSPTVEPSLEAYFEVLPCNGDCWCADPVPPVGYGEPCLYACDCAPGLQCVSYTTLLGVLISECLPSCSVWSDCAPGRDCEFWDDGPWGVCGPREPALPECASQGECPPGFRCEPDAAGQGTCRSAIDPAAEGQWCACDLECGGLACIKAEGEDMWWNECRLPCRGPRDCPEGWGCAEADWWYPPVCIFGAPAR